MSQIQKLFTIVILLLKSLVHTKQKYYIRKLCPWKIQIKKKEKKTFKLKISYKLSNDASSCCICWQFYMLSQCTKVFIFTRTSNIVKIVSFSFLFLFIQRYKNEMRKLSTHTHAAATWAIRDVKNKRKFIKILFANNDKNLNIFFIIFSIWYQSAFVHISSSSSCLCNRA